jgi:hypothetical protein
LSAAAWLCTFGRILVSKWHVRTLGFKFWSTKLWIQTSYLPCRLPARTLSTINSKLCLLTSFFIMQPLCTFWSNAALLPAACGKSSPLLYVAFTDTCFRPFRPFRVYFPSFCTSCISFSFFSFTMCVKLFCYSTIWLRKFTVLYTTRKMCVLNCM